MLIFIYFLFLFPPLWPYTLYLLNLFTRLNTTTSCSSLYRPFHFKYRCTFALSCHEHDRQNVRLVKLFIIREPLEFTKTIFKLLENPIKIQFPVFPSCKTSFAHNPIIFFIAWRYLFILSRRNSSCSLKYF